MNKDKPHCEFCVSALTNLISGREIKFYKIKIYRCDNCGEITEDWIIKGEDNEQRKSYQNAK